MQRLNLSGRKTQFLLQTMGQERVVPVNVLSGLEVSAIDGNIFYQLPDTLTQKQMPVSSDSMVSKRDLSKWPYLKKVTVPRIMANVELLIGNCHDLGLLLLSLSLSLCCTHTHTHTHTCILTLTPLSLPHLFVISISVRATLQCHLFSLI